MKKQAESRRRPGTKVKIGNQVFASIKAASRALNQSDGYIFDRIRNNDSMMPDGTKIEILKDEADIRSHTFTIKLTDEMNAYLEQAADVLGVSKAWVWEKLFYYGRKQLDKEISGKK